MCAFNSIRLPKPIDKYRTLLVRFPGEIYIKQDIWYLSRVIIFDKFVTTDVLKVIGHCCKNVYKLADQYQPGKSTRRQVVPFLFVVGWLFAHLTIMSVHVCGLCYTAEEGYIPRCNSMDSPPVLSVPFIIILNGIKTMD